MIIITGGAGFVGSNLIRKLNNDGYSDIIIVDDINTVPKIKNMKNLDFSDYIDKERFLSELKQGAYNKYKISAILHNGACTDTTNNNVEYLMKNNYYYSKELLNYSVQKRIPFIYASSASIYGDGINGFQDENNLGNPLNAYAFSKWLFDKYVLWVLKTAKNQIVGLRYFNVFGFGESHKSNMASLIFHLCTELILNDTLTIFTLDNYPKGAQKRDFIFIDDIVDINLFFLKNPNLSGIFNCGTGKAMSFKDIAEILIKIHGKGSINFSTIPDNLREGYQTYTKAEISRLKGVGYHCNFKDFETCLSDYYFYLKNYLK
ncbi:ADP-glyceromanno-heptose 6-epimerase [Bacillus cereus]|uniref:ADP-glyceromanno-heptose 6-epimerase n=1 Tax=Bacillus cereus TaxID=1396 RepID=UPI00065B589F|nr:ADP-glyceromanno-heptose 6-epimerase [Bacillus cereus]KMQ32160.1 hypothetical protein TU58_01350 [Bacillus cereus]